MPGGDFRPLDEALANLHRFALCLGRAPRTPRICKPARRMLDRLRVLFPYIVAVALPLAGAVLAVVRLVDGDRDDALRIAAASVLGLALYALLLF